MKNSNLALAPAALMHGASRLAVVLAALTAQTRFEPVRGRKNRRILRTIVRDGVEYAYHATKGYRAQRLPA